MTVVGLLMASIVWLITLIPASGFLMATAMISDAGVQDRIEMLMITSAIILASAYYVIIPAMVVVAWGSFVFDNISLAQIALFAPVIYIVVYIINIGLIFLRRSSGKNDG